MPYGNHHADNRFWIARFVRRGDEGRDSGNCARIEDLGESVKSMIPWNIPSPVYRERLIELHVLSTDRFGNLITDLTRAEFEKWSVGIASSQIEVRIGATHFFGISRTYADVSS